MAIKIVFDCDDFHTLLLDAVIAYNSDEKICNKIIFDILNTGKVKDLVMQKIVELTDNDPGDDLTEALAETVEEICTEYADLLAIDPPADDEDREDTDLPEIIENITTAFEDFVTSLSSTLHKILVEGFMGESYIISVDKLPKAQILSFENCPGDMMLVEIK